MAASKQASKQASKHTHARAQCSHANVGLAHARPNKQVKQHDYVTSLQSDEGLHHDNTSKMFVRITVQIVV